MGLYPDKRRCERACPLSLSFCISTGRKGQESRQQECGYVQARKRILTRNQVLPDLDFGLSSLQNWDKINFCCFSHPVCGIQLWQMELTNTVSKYANIITCLVDILIIPNSVQTLLRCNNFTSRVYSTEAHPILQKYMYESIHCSTLEQKRDQ